MKNIAVILPTNNPEILSQADLESYQTKDCTFKVHYVDTPLREIKTAEEAAILLPLAVKKFQQVAAEGADAAIIFAFGDLGIKEAKELVAIPVMSLGVPAIHMASVLCKKHYTVIPAILNQDSFIVDMIKHECLEQKYIRATHAPEITPAEIRKDSNLLEKLVTTISPEITEKNIDTFVLGCGSFIGVSKKLETALQAKFNRPITVIDTIELAFNIAKTLI